jgi:hypothetical protein
MIARIPPTITQALYLSVCSIYLHLCFGWACDWHVMRDYQSMYVHTTLNQVGEWAYLISD